MPAVTNAHIINWVLDEKMTEDGAIRKSMELGLDHVEVAKFFGIKLPEPEDEEKAPKLYRITARGIPHETPNGTKFPYLYAGRHGWSRDPMSSSTHDLCQTQYDDVVKKVKTGTLFIISEEKLDPKRKTQPRASSSSANS